jgi:hypothetical protein
MRAGFPHRNISVQQELSTAIVFPRPLGQIRALTIIIDIFFRRPKTRRGLAISAVIGQIGPLPERFLVILIQMEPCPGLVHRSSRVIMHVVCSRIGNG